MILNDCLSQHDYLQQQICCVDERLDSALQPYSESIELLKTIPSISHHSARSVLIEIGPDISVFGTAAQFSAWYRTHQALPVPRLPQDADRASRLQARHRSHSAQARTLHLRGVARQAAVPRPDGRLRAHRRPAQRRALVAATRKVRPVAIPAQWQCPCSLPVTPVYAAQRLASVA